MFRELEEALRELARQQGVPIPDPEAQRRARQARQRAEEAEEAIDVEIVDAEPIYEDIATHVRSSIDTTDVSGRATHLGATVGLADDKLEAHLHEVFDHRIGQLHGGARAKSPVEGDTSLVNEIIEALQNPQSIRRAIIMSEVLNPPSHRW